ncbi:MAG: hypothetical protein IKH16_12555, partial [Selenomonadaceae bacterium]|nr:hypothetical protein [Selenomonadaceae bacterium]
MDERLNWLMLADKFASDGDPRGMRACARELFDLDARLADGPAVMAEAALYSGSYEEADMLAHDALGLDGKNLRARLVLAGVAGQEFRLDEELRLLKEVVEGTRRRLEQIERLQRELNVRNHLGQGIPEDEKLLRANQAAEMKIFRKLLAKARGWMADAYYLAAEPERAANALKEASSLTEDPEKRADLYSKYLFMQNYRSAAPESSRRAAEKYASLLVGITPYAHQEVKRLPEKRLRIGYISPDFRLHAVAYFVAPLLRDFNEKEFAVYCYSRGTGDAVTGRFRKYPVKWQDIRGRSARTAARMIAEDHIDILVDLSGHSQGNCLDIMAYRPAPVQISGIGYMNTTGLPTIDYILSDEVCMPIGKNEGFTEKPLRLKGCHLCYDPGAVREMPLPGKEAPVLVNGCVTFGCFNNFAKVTDELICLWRGAMDRVRDSRIVIKGKICSIPSGQKLVRERLMRLHFPMGRVELRPFSQDYLEQYSDIDLSLDTTPYTGGLTTCESLFMGVPVVTLRGRSHGARFGASILQSAGLEELVADNQMEYVKKIVQIASNKDLIQRYRSALREHLLKSRLMDGKAYMKELEEKYREIW